MSEALETRIRPVEGARTAVRRAVEDALAAATDSDRLPAMPSGADIPAIEVVRPTNAAHGDFSTNLALKLARPLRHPPLEIATAVRDALTSGSGTGSAIGEVTVAPPGFLNVRLAPDYLETSLDAARQAGPAFGRVEARRGERINVEFVSANPTGPLHIGNARGAFVGDLLCRVLEAVGHDVTREYYFNDAGTQVRNLGESVRCVRLGEPIPEDGYRGEYVADLASELPEEIWARAASDQTGSAWIIGEWASERVRAGIESSLARLGVRFDVEDSSVHVPADQQLIVQNDIGDQIPKIEDGPWPLFPADLTSIALTVSTQAHGTVLIFEKMFESRLFFVDKLVSMGARIVLCDPHRALVSGPSQLYGQRMESPDIRAGWALLIASLCAEGTSRIGNIEQIVRGYERIDERLRALGARIERADG